MKLHNHVVSALFHILKYRPNSIWTQEKLWIVLYEPVYPEPRGPWVLPVDELVLWYGMFAPFGRL